MPVPARFLLKQGANVAALARAGLGAWRSKGRSGGAVQAPGPVLTRTIRPPSADHVATYVHHVGGQPSAYKNTVPAHMFSFWAFDAMSWTLQGLPFDLTKALNAGVTLTQTAPLPASGTWILTACLQDVQDDERRTLLVQRITTGPESAPEALVAEVRILIPKRGDKKGPKLPPKLVPSNAAEIGWWRLPSDAGLDFALLTGDFNPIHWIPAAGRAAGFRGCILHGFSTLSRSVEGLIAARLAGRVDGVASIDARFVRPVGLPGKVGLYVTEGRELLVGPAPGTPANLVATFTLSEATP